MIPEQWVKIRNFPEYSISSHGRVRNDVTDRIMALTQNQHRVVNVGLMRGPKQFRRSVTVMVADAFVPKIRNKAFDTPINLDGDRSNNYADNLMWRPRWFATRYHRQFFQRSHKFVDPILLEDTGEVFEYISEPAVKYGLLEDSIMESILTGSGVWPTGHRFRYLKN